MYIDNLMNKEILYYLLFTEGDRKLEHDRSEFTSGIGISDSELLNLKLCALDSHVRIACAFRAYPDILQNNKEVSNILKSCYQQILLILGDRTSMYEEWIRNWWEKERSFRMEAIKESNNRAGEDITIYATQYDAETSNEVALPDKYVKFATRGWFSDIPSNLRQYYNRSYSVKVTYGNKVLSSVPVNDVGPWNTDDNYWDSMGSGNKRRYFIDLATYVPEAYAAYFDNYNNGLDLSGRTVTNPAGIDLCRTVAKSLGFSSYGSGYIRVDFSSLP